MSTPLKLSVADPEFVDKIIFEVKSQGHFDMFRKECLADVDTQPAYQNLHSRVEDSVQKFLNRQVWTPDTNKNRLREEMRHNIIRAGYLDSGVSRIVDQIVEQKMDYIHSKVEEILYQYVGIEKQQKKPQPPQQQENGTTTALEVDTDLLPTDLEQVSPDSDKKSTQAEEVEEEVVDDFESPAFEPIGVETVTTEKPDETQNSNLSEISGLTSQDSPTEKTQAEENQDETMLSQISSTEKSSTSFVNPTDNNEMTGEEAQMPPEITDESMPIVKEPEPMVVESPKFDLNKDSIEFTGTERKNILSDESTNSNDDKTASTATSAATPAVNDSLSKAAQMEVDNLDIDNNDTTDSSEVRMEIDLKDESTQESSSKVDDANSQDSSQKAREKSDRDVSRSHHSSSSKHHKRDRSKDRHKSSSSSHHRSSSGSHRHHSSKSSSSRHESSSSKRSSGKSSSSSSSHKKSSTTAAATTTSSDKDTNRTSSSSSSHKKSKHRDDHHSSSSSVAKARRKSTEPEPADEKQAKIDDNERAEDIARVDEKSESSADAKKKSSILMKYDYLKGDEGGANETQQRAEDDEDDADFHGFAVAAAPEGVEEKSRNPWMQFLQTESERIRKASARAAAKVTRKSKSPDSIAAEELAQETKVAQQRYDPQELYKPRFDFSNRHRRRGQNVEEPSTSSTASTATTTETTETAAKAQK